MTSHTLSIRDKKKRVHGGSIVVALAVLTGVLAEAPAGFNLSPSLIPRGEIRSGGPGKDGIPALEDPVLVQPAEADYLTHDDLVIGLDVEGVSRAYPLRILVWHEIANDVVGGRAVAVTYCPLCQSALVFDRKVGGEKRTFGVSGKLYNSNVLMYDRQAHASQESLWSQGEMRAVTGPAARQGLTLKLLPAELTGWGDWLTRHPETTVLSVDTGHERPYRNTAYASYFATDQLMFPVNTRTKAPKGVGNKDLFALVYAESASRAYAVRDVKAAGGALVDQLGDRHLRLVYVADGNSVRIETTDDGPMPAVAYMFWFALSALQPDVEIYQVK